MLMTKKNALTEGLLTFLLGLVKVCVAIALMTGTVVASAFLAIQGVSVIREKYGFHGVVIAWLIMFMILMFTCALFQEKREQDKTQHTRSEAPAENDRHSLESKETSRD